MMRLLWALALWAALAWGAGLPAFLLPGPWDVAEVLWAKPGYLAFHAGLTLLEASLGLMIGAVLGLALAAGLDLSPRLDRALAPWLVLSQTVPVFVLAPFLTLWFGYGIGPKVAMAVLLVFFPVLGALRAALAAIPEAAHDMARIAGAGRMRRLVWLAWPWVRQSFAAGLAMGATYAPTGAVIGEWVGSAQGLGQVMLRANARAQTAEMFAALLLLVALTLGLRACVGGVLRFGQE
jgi:putative hydroxymethylpyrimidine transport system permease protein